MCQVILYSTGAEAFTRDEKLAYVQMTYDEFDQQKNGWRSIAKLGMTKSHGVEAAQIIRYYLKKRKGLTRWQRSNLWFHAGQNLAKASEYSKAVACFCKSLDSAGDDWDCYVRATIAFLKRDLSALQAERDKLALTQRKMNLVVVDRLIANFDKSYAEAY